MKYRWRKRGDERWDEHPKPLRTVIGRETKGLREGYAVPKDRVTTRQPVTQRWTVSVKVWRAFVPTVDRVTKEEGTAVIPCRAVYCSTSGGPDCFPNHWRIWVSRRGGDVGLNLSSSFDGETWVKDRTLTLEEAVYWLYARAGQWGTHCLAHAIMAEL